MDQRIICVACRCGCPEPPHADPERPGDWDALSPSLPLHVALTGHNLWWDDQPGSPTYLSLLGAYLGDGYFEADLRSRAEPQDE